MNSFKKEAIYKLAIILFVLYVLYKEAFPMVHLVKDSIQFVNIVLAVILSAIVSYFVSKIASSNAVYEIDKLKKDVDQFSSHFEGIKKDVDNFKSEITWQVTKK